MSTPLTIRKAKEDDIIAIAQLLLELSRAEGGSTATGTEALMQAMFERNRRVPLQAIVAETNQTIVGAILYYWGYDVSSASDGYHLADMIVSQPMRNKTVGRQLYLALAKQCLAQQGHWISLTVLKKNIAAKNFYRSIGMQPIAVDFFAIGPEALAKLGS